MSFSCFLVGATVALAAAPAHVQSAAPLRVMGFSGSTNWPIFVAQEKGLFGVGGSGERLAALRSGRAAGALLNAPQDAVAEAAGFVRLANSAEIIGRYQGSVGAARRAWATANAGALVGYIRAYVAAVDWLYDPANRAEAMEILQRRLADVSPGNAARSYDELLHPSHGSLSRKAAIDPEGVRTVLALRREFARPARPLSDPSRYYDPAYYERALRNE